MSDAHTRVGSAGPFEVDDLEVTPGPSGAIDLYICSRDGQVRLSSTQVDELIRALGGVPAGDLVPLLELDGVQTYSIKPPEGT